mmetsp:Transcript_38393/g.121300  ORF Transcript_38393/g.121300 Transcript_38393/m.121300 type:complete len:120 (-) Transcript_38393:68-427(-)
MAAAYTMIIDWEHLARFLRATLAPREEGDALPCSDPEAVDGAKSDDPPRAAGGEERAAVCIAGVVLLAMATATAASYDQWPLSHYPMFSEGWNETHVCKIPTSAFGEREGLLLIAKVRV